MAVFGVVPRAFYEFETPQMTAITGAADRDATVFETALRLRQIALTAIQQSLAEDRLTRATLHRSHRVDTTELVPGTSTVEIYRDAAWRGPATLLEADQEEGTAIVKHQGKPYLMPLRFVRPSKGVFYNVDSYTGTSLYKLMTMTEEVQPYKQSLLATNVFRLHLASTGRALHYIQMKNNNN